MSDIASGGGQLWLALREMATPLSKAAGACACLAPVLTPVYLTPVMLALLLAASPWMSPGLEQSFELAPLDAPTAVSTEAAPVEDICSTDDDDDGDSGGYAPPAVTLAHAV